MAAQFDLFSTDEPARPLERGATRRPAIALALSEEDMAARLEASGRYRILRRLEPRSLAAPRPDYPLRGVVLDTETTGLDHRAHEIIEIGLISFSFKASSAR